MLQSIVEQQLANQRARDQRAELGRRYILVGLYIVLWLAVLFCLLEYATR